MNRSRPWQWALTASLATMALMAVTALWVATLDIGPDGSALPYSTEVKARDGRLLRAFQTEDERWRLPVTAKEVDPLYLAMLFAYEDRRFGSHGGVDPLAAGRALWQILRHGRIVSGGSTLSMQVARLLNDRRESRSLSKKLTEAGRALRLEARLGKARMLDLYLSLAPFGGNIEGVREASLFYFGKEPKRLSPAEAALLVALPQSPEARRPDRHPEAARTARDRVLVRMREAGIISADHALQAMRESVPHERRPAPALAWHAAEEAVRAFPQRQSHHLTLDRTLQDNLEALARERVRTMPAQQTLAIIVIDHKSSEVLARIGNADPASDLRRGAVDITRAVRSPGSTLKPFIYAMAFESGLVHPETLIDDRPTRFGGWGPANFDRAYQGVVPVRQALQLSLNVPAVALLELVGPQRLTSRFSGIGAATLLPRGESPGLAIALGGVGITPLNLGRLYAALARRGDALPLRERLDVAADLSPRRAFGAPAAHYVAEALLGTPPPDGAAGGRFAYKTGTSYGYRDGWAAGFDGRHVVIVWVGRADGTAVPGLTGLKDAAPILFEAFQRLGPPRAFPAPPADALMARNAALPQHLRRFGQKAGDNGADTRAQLRIATPADGAHVDLGFSRNSPQALFAKAQGGAAPYVWLLDDRPAGDPTGDAVVELAAKGVGLHSLTVIDAEGRSHSVSFRAE